MQAVIAKSIDALSQKAGLAVGCQKSIIDSGIVSKLPSDGSCLRRMHGTFLIATPEKQTSGQPLPRYCWVLQDLIRRLYLRQEQICDVCASAGFSSSEPCHLMR